VGNRTSNCCWCTANSGAFDGRTPTSQYQRHCFYVFQ